LADACWLHVRSAEVCTLAPYGRARAETVDVLRAHQEAQILARAFAGDAYIDADLVFADELGEFIHPQRLTQLFRRAPRGGRHPVRHPACAPPYRSDVGAHVRRPVSHRGRPARRRPEDGALTYAHLLPQSDEFAAERVAHSSMAEASMAAVNTQATAPSRVSPPMPEGRKCR